jgi:hypothetical protein
MSTVYRQAVKKTVDDLVCDNPEWARLLIATLKDIKSKTVYPQSYVDVLGQVFRGLDIYDAWCFLQIHSNVKMGMLGFFQVETGQEPSNDKDIEHNNGVMSALHYPFSGCFSGGLSDYSDGNFYVDAPVNAQVEQQGQRGFVIAEFPKTNHTNQIPLEVGYQAFEKTWMNLFSEQGVIARWPYYSTKITVIFRTDRFGVGVNCERFNNVVNSVWGDFDSLPAVFDNWNAELNKKRATQ